MSLAKLFAITFCGAVLLVQAYAVITPLKHKDFYQNWYWPFVNYPMYSDPHRVGESFSSLDLRVVPCGPDAEPRPVTSRELRVRWAPYQSMLFQAARLQDTTTAGVGERAALELRHVVATRLSFPACTVQLWRRSYMIGPRGLEPTDSAWRVAVQWNLTRSDSIAPDVSVKQ